MSSYQLSGAKHTAAFPPPSAAEGDFSKPLVNLQQPVINGLSGVFQGYAAYGQHLYVLMGTLYENTAGKVNSEVTSAKNEDGSGRSQQGPLLTKSGGFAVVREPEGMAVYATASGEPGLFLGFAAGARAGQRRSNVFYKNGLVKK